MFAHQNFEFCTWVLIFVCLFCHFFIILLITLYFLFWQCSSVLLTIYASESSEFESDSFSNSSNCFTKFSQKPSWGSKNWYEVVIFKQVGFKCTWGGWYYKSSISSSGKCLQAKTLSFVHEFSHLSMSFHFCSYALPFLYQLTYYVHFVFCFNICSSVLLTIYASELSEFESNSLSNSSNCSTKISQKPSWGSKNWYEVAIFKQVGFKCTWGRWYFKSSISSSGKCLQTKTLSFGMNLSCTRSK